MAPIRTAFATDPNVVEKFTCVLFTPISGLVAPSDNEMRVTLMRQNFESGRDALKIGENTHDLSTTKRFDAKSLSLPSTLHARIAS